MDTTAGANKIELQAVPIRTKTDHFMTVVRSSWKPHKPLDEPAGEKLTLVHNIFSLADNYIDK